MRKINKTIAAFAVLALGLTSCSSGDRIDQMIAEMTLEQKVGQLNLLATEGNKIEDLKEQIRRGEVGAILKSNGVEQNLMLQKIAVEESETGIPILFQEDVIHGYRTISPIPLAESASWDMDVIGRSAALAARETAAAGVMLTYAPMVDVTRDPRWGRILETSGEDPYLSSCVAAARVHGFQEGNENPEQNILACAKHFAGYGASLAGRDYNIQDVSERELRELYLPSFQAAVDAGVASIMCAYTMYNGEPVTASDFLLKDVLRGEMGFEGLVMTDWRTIPNMVNIGVCEDGKEAAKVAIESGIDMDMTSKEYMKHLPELVRSGKVDEKLLDAAVRKALELKERIGLLDNPYAYMDKEVEAKELLSDKNKAEAKEMALKSMVLLKNEGNVLPIVDKKIKNIAVIGTMANTRRDLLGWWEGKGRANETQTILEGLKAKFGKDYNISYAEGCKIDSFKMAGVELIPEAVQLARRSDLVIMVLGEKFWMSGEGGGIADLDLPGAQVELLEAVAKTGKPIVSVMVTGRPYILTDVEKASDAILQAWMPGTMAGDAVAEILAGEFNPSGKLPVTFPLHQGQIPIFYSYKRTSHTFNQGPAGDRYSTTYRDIESTPLYAFGYGLSYTTFGYSDITLSSEEMTKDGSLTASVEVTNTGDIKGREVVQMYIGDVVCSVVRPEKQLKDFAVVELEAGESKTVSFTVTPEKLEFIAHDLSTAIEEGEFRLFIGTNSAELKETKFTLK